jgi:hypothetical protein
MVMSILIAIGKGIHVAIVEEGVVAISPGELLIVELTRSTNNLDASSEEFIALEIWWGRRVCHGGKGIEAGKSHDGDSNKN